jgi:class I fructose-bisphosphate aldolase
MNHAKIVELLGRDAQSLLGFAAPRINKSTLQLPGPDWVERCIGPSDRSVGVLRSLTALFGQGNLANTGYLSILPVDQGVEHSAGASFSANPDYFDPENIIKLALEGGCNGVVSTLGVLGSVARRYAHKIPFILKLNHNELLSYPNRSDQILFADVKQAFELGAVAVGATIYFGSPQSDRQIVEVSRCFAQAHQLGMATVLWCYLRNSAFTLAESDYHRSADLTGQANHLGVSIQADIIKQKQPLLNGGYAELNKQTHFGKYDPRMYEKLCSPHPIDLTRYQVLNCYAGRSGLINSGGASGADDLAQVIKSAVINKRAGGMGLICGRKAFGRPLREGVALLEAIQAVYLDKEITVA